MSDEHLNRIETALAHHEKQIQDLSEMIQSQWKEIDTLKRRLADAHSKLKDLQTGSGDPEPTEPMSVAEIAAAEKPPHY